MKKKKNKNNTVEKCQITYKDECRLGRYDCGCDASESSFCENRLYLVDEIKSKNKKKIK